MKYVSIPQYGEGIKLTQINGKPLMESSESRLPPELYDLAQELVERLPEKKRPGAQMLLESLANAGTDKPPVTEHSFLIEYMLSDDRMGRKMKLKNGEASAYEVSKAARRIDEAFANKGPGDVVSVEDRDHEIGCVILTEAPEPLGRDGQPVKGLTLFGLAAHVIRQLWPLIEAFVEAKDKPPSAAA